MVTTSIGTQKQVLIFFTVPMGETQINFKTILS